MPTTVYIYILRELSVVLWFYVHWFKQYFICVHIYYKYIYFFYSIFTRENVIFVLLSRVCINDRYFNIYNVYNILLSYIFVPMFVVYTLYDWCVCYKNTDDSIIMTLCWTKMSFKKISLAWYAEIIVIFTVWYIIRM